MRSKPLNEPWDPMDHEFGRNDKVKAKDGRIGKVKGTGKEGMVYVDFGDGRPTGKFHAGLEMVKKWVTK
ncbi:MAG: hypothetical protein ACWGQW_17595 [bacterium]